MSSEITLLAAGPSRGLPLRSFSALQLVPACLAATLRRLTVAGGSEAPVRSRARARPKRQVEIYPLEGAAVFKVAVQRRRHKCVRGRARLHSLCRGRRRITHSCRLSSSCSPVAKLCALAGATPLDFAHLRRVLTMRAICTSVRCFVLPLGFSGMLNTRVRTPLCCDVDSVQCASAARRRLGPLAQHAYGKHMPAQSERAGNGPHARA